MKNKLFILGLLFLSVGCDGTNQQRGYVAQGELYVPQREIYLCVNNENKIDTISKSKIINGKFRFEGVAEIPQNAYIVCDDYKKIEIILENCNYNFKIDLLDDTKIEAVISGEESKIKSSLDTLKLELKNKVADVYKQTRREGIASSEAATIVSRLQEEYRIKEEDLIIKPNPNSFVAMNLVYDSGNRLSDEQFCQRFDMLGDEYFTHPTYKDMSEKYRINKNIRVGNAAPNFTVAKESGDSLSLYDIKSKFKVIYVTQIGSLSDEDIDSIFKRLHKKYERGDLEIIELAIDNDKANWLEAVKRSGKNWLQFHLADGWDNSILTQYNRKRVPYIYLLDAENRFLSIGTTATEVSEIVNNTK